MSTLEKLNSLEKEYDKLVIEINKNAIAYVEEVLAEHNGIIPLDYDEYEYPYVMYNGGRHPEYKSGYDSATKIYTDEDGKAVVRMEYAEQYLDEFGTADLLTIVDFVSAVPWDSLDDDEDDDEDE